MNAIEKINSVFVGESEMESPFVLHVSDVGTIQVDLKDGKFDVTITYCLWNNQEDNDDA
jgi:hypothetical protein